MLNKESKYIYKINKFDILLASVAVIVTLAWFLLNIFSSNSGKSALIYINNELYDKVTLSEDGEYIISENDIYLKLVINKAYLDVIDASCKDKYCIHQKSISKSGELIVCLPQKIVIKISDEGDDDECDLINNIDKNNVEEEFDAYTN